MNHFYQQLTLISKVEVRLVWKSATTEHRQVELSDGTRTHYFALLRFCSDKKKCPQWVVCKYSDKMPEWASVNLQQTAETWQGNAKQASTGWRVHIANTWGQEKTALGENLMGLDRTKRWVIHPNSNVDGRNNRQTNCPFYEKFSVYLNFICIRWRRFVCQQFLIRGTVTEWVIEGKITIR